MQQQGSVTFQIFSTAILDADAENQFRTQADYIADPSAFGDASIDIRRIDIVENSRADYFGVYGNVILLDGQIFIAPDLSVHSFFLGTITIEFIAVVSEPGALTTGLFGVSGLFIINYRRRTKQI